MTNPEFIIEEFYDSIFKRNMYRMKYGGYWVEIHQDDGKADCFEIRYAMQRLKQIHSEKDFRYHEMLINGGKNGS